MLAGWIRVRIPSLRRRLCVTFVRKFILILIYILTSLFFILLTSFHPFSGLGSTVLWHIHRNIGVTLSRMEPAHRLYPGGGNNRIRATLDTSTLHLSHYAYEDLGITWSNLAILDDGRCGFIGIVTAHIEICMLFRRLGRLGLGLDLGWCFRLDKDE